MRSLLSTHLTASQVPAQSMATMLDSMIEAFRSASFVGEQRFDGLAEAISRSMQDQGVSQAPPAAAAAVAGLKKYSWKQSAETQECPICLYKYQQVSPTLSVFWDLGRASCDVILLVG